MNLFNSKYILSDKRYAWLDYDRGISIILVTYRHCFESLKNSGIDLQRFPFFEYINVFLFGFRMPLFFIASGIFISSSINRKGLGSYSKTRIRNILYPLLLWGTIQISLQLIFTSYTNNTSTPIQYIKLIVDPRSTGQFWYLNTLFFVGIFYAITKVKLKFEIWQQITLGITLYFFAFILRSEGYYLGFVMDIFQYYLFFGIGDFISKLMKDKKNEPILSSYKPLAILIPSFILIQYYFTEINMLHKSNYYVEHHMPVFFLLVAFVGCTLSINISFLLKKHDSLKFLRVIGYNSIHIYCLQVIAMALSRIIYMKVFHLTYPPVLILLVLISGLFIPMIFYNICLRNNIWWLFSLQKPKEEIIFMQNEKNLVKIKI